MTTSQRIRELAARAIVLSGLPGITRALLWRDRVAVLLYHDPDPDTLDAHLTYLKRYCDFVPMSATDMPGNGRPRAALTFDDGHAGNAALLPVFIKHGIRPTIYLCSSIVAQERTHWWLTPGARSAGVKRLIKLPDQERIDELAALGFRQDMPSSDTPPSGLSAEQIRTMLPHVDFQSHTRYHPTLTRMGHRECQEEIEGSRQEVEQLTGAPCAHFAYPYGRYGAREVVMLRNAGYKTARTTAVGWNDHRSDPFRLKAFDIDDAASEAWFAAQMTGATLAWRYLPLSQVKAALIRLGAIARPRRPGPPAGRGSQA